MRNQRLRMESTDETICIAKASSEIIAYAFILLNQAASTTYSEKSKVAVRPFLPKFRDRPVSAVQKKKGGKGTADHVLNYFSDSIFLLHFDLYSRVPYSLTQISF